MTMLFVDTSFYVALVNPRDTLHARAMELAGRFSGPFMTTEYVLIETANFLHLTLPIFSLRIFLSSSPPIIFADKFYKMTSQMIIGIVITLYLLAVGGLFAIEFIKNKRNKGQHKGHH